MGLGICRSRSDRKQQLGSLGRAHTLRPRHRRQRHALVHPRAEYVVSRVDGMAGFRPSGTAKPGAPTTPIFKERSIIELFFNRLKQFRRGATRYDRLLVTFMGFVKLAVMAIWLK